MRLGVLAVAALLGALAWSCSDRVESRNDPAGSAALDDRTAASIATKKTTSAVRVYVDGASGEPIDLPPGPALPPADDTDGRQGATRLEVVVSARAGEGLTIDVPAGVLHEIRALVGAAGGPRLQCDRHPGSSATHAHQGDAGQ